MDSFLEKTILDGRPVTHVTSAGKTSLTEDCFAPKPPPIRGLITRTLEDGMFSAFPTILRIWNGIWVEETTVSL